MTWGALPRELHQWPDDAWGAYLKECYALCDQYSSGYGLLNVALWVAIQEEAERNVRIRWRTKQ